MRPVHEKLLAQNSNHPTKHLITNLSIDVEPGAITASSHCCWIVLRKTPGERIDIALSGQYTDSFEKVPDGWRFTDRLITVGLTGAPSSPVT